MKKQTWLIILLVLFLSRDGYAELSTPSDRDQLRKDYGHEVRIGLLAHDVDHLWSRSKKESGVDFNVEVLFERRRLDLPRGGIRPNVGISVNNRGDTSKIYGGILWEAAALSPFFNIGIGLAVHDGELEAKKDDKKGLGARILFRIPIEAGLTIKRRHRVSILFEHISNGYLAHPNEGLDSLGLRYSLLFD
jgi:lipid A 3-O-deacylase